MKLNSTDINDPPAVDTNILKQQDDVDRVVMCLERERQFFAALDDLGVNTTEMTPGLETTPEVVVRTVYTVCGRQLLLTLECWKKSAAKQSAQRRAVRHGASLTI